MSIVIKGDPKKKLIECTATGSLQINFEFFAVTTIQSIG